jgi:hypothetical protein
LWYARAVKYKDSGNHPPDLINSALLELGLKLKNANYRLDEGLEDLTVVSRDDAKVMHELQFRGYSEYSGLVGLPVFDSADFTNQCYSKNIVMRHVDYAAAVMRKVELMLKEPSFYPLHLR